MKRKRRKATRIAKKKELEDEKRKEKEEAEKEERIKNMVKYLMNISPNVRIPK